MKILIADDGLVSSHAVVEDMRRAGLPADAKAFLVCVTGVDPAQGSTTRDRIQTHFPQWELSSDTLPGSPAEVILKTTQWWRPDLLVIGSDAFALERTRAMSVPLELLHRARCSVRVARLPMPGTGGPVRLVIGNNGSKACEAVIHEVARRRWPENTHAHVVTVIDSTTSQDQQRRTLSTAEEECIGRLRATGLTVNRRVVHGDPCRELVRESEDSNADTIFVGPRCQPAASRFLVGSVATAVVTRARSTVEVVRKLKAPS